VGSLPHRCGYRIYSFRECGACVGKLACGSQNRLHECANSRQGIPLPLHACNFPFLSHICIKKPFIPAFTTRVHNFHAFYKMHENAWIVRRSIMIKQICIFDFQDIFTAFPCVAQMQLLYKNPIALTFCFKIIYEYSVRSYEICNIMQYYNLLYYASIIL